MKTSKLLLIIFICLMMISSVSALTLTKGISPKDFSELNSEELLKALEEMGGIEFINHELVIPLPELESGKVYLSVKQETPNLKRLNMLLKYDSLDIKDNQYEKIKEFAEEYFRTARPVGLNPEFVEAMTQYHFTETKASSLLAKTTSSDKKVIDFNLAPHRQNIATSSAEISSLFEKYWGLKYYNTYNTLQLNPTNDNLLLAVYILTMQKVVEQNVEKVETFNRAEMAMVYYQIINPLYSLEANNPDGAREVAVNYFKKNFKKGILYVYGDLLPGEIKLLGAHNSITVSKGKEDEFPGKDIFIAWNENDLSFTYRNGKHKVRLYNLQALPADTKLYLEIKDKLDGRSTDNYVIMTIDYPDYIQKKDKTIPGMEFVGDNTFIYRFLVEDYILNLPCCTDSKDEKPLTIDEINQPMGQDCMRCSPKAEDTSAAHITEPEPVATGLKPIACGMGTLTNKKYPEYVNPTTKKPLPVNVECTVHNGLDVDIYNKNTPASELNLDYTEIILDQPKIDGSNGLIARSGKTTVNGGTIKGRHSGILVFEGAEIIINGPNIISDCPIKTRTNKQIFTDKNTNNKWVSEFKKGHAFSPNDPDSYCWSIYEEPCCVVTEPLTPSQTGEPLNFDELNQPMGNDCIPCFPDAKDNSDDWIADPTRVAIPDIIIDNPELLEEIFPPKPDQCAGVPKGISELDPKPTNKSEVQKYINKYCWPPQWCPICNELVVEREKYKEVHVIKVSQEEDLDEGNINQADTGADEEPACRITEAQAELFLELATVYGRLEKYGVEKINNKFNKPNDALGEKYWIRFEHIRLTLEEQGISIYDSVDLFKGTTDWKKAWKDIGNECKKKTKWFPGKNIIKTIGGIFKSDKDVLIPLDDFEDHLLDRLSIKYDAVVLYEEDDGTVTVYDQGKDECVKWTKAADGNITVDASKCINGTKVVLETNRVRTSVKKRNMITVEEDGTVKGKTDEKVDIITKTGTVTMNAEGVVVKTNVEVATEYQAKIAAVQKEINAKCNKGWKVGCNDLLKQRDELKIKAAKALGQITEEEYNALMKPEGTFEAAKRKLFLEKYKVDPNAKVEYKQFKISVDPDKAKIYAELAKIQKEINAYDTKVKTTENKVYDAEETNEITKMAIPRETLRKQLRDAGDPYVDSKPATMTFEQWWQYLADLGKAKEDAEAAEVASGTGGASDEPKETTVSNENEGLTFTFKSPSHDVTCGLTIDFHNYKNFVDVDTGITRPINIDCSGLGIKYSNERAEIIMEQPKITAKEFPGILVNKGTVTVDGGTISGGSSGIQVNKDGVLILKGNPQITGNCQIRTMEGAQVLVYTENEWIPEKIEVKAPTNYPLYSQLGPDSFNIYCWTEHKNPTSTTKPATPATTGTGATTNSNTATPPVAAATPNQAVAGTNSGETPPPKPPIKDVNEKKVPWFKAFIKSVGNNVAFGTPGFSGRIFLRP
ncbi:MAG: hypothetical protein ABIB43_02370 [archaeon]